MPARLLDINQFPARFSLRDHDPQGPIIVLKLTAIWMTANRIAPGASTPPGRSPTLLLTDADLDLRDADIDPNDPDLPDFVRERGREKQEEKRLAFDLERTQQQHERATREQDDADKEHRRAWLASEQYRQAMLQLSQDIADAKAAAQLAYERALVREQERHDALEEARRQALVTSGGRVYFTRDGSQLYDEDGTRITDAVTVAEARRQQERQPNATSYEDFIERRDALVQAAADAESNRATLDRLAALETRTKQDDLSPNALAQAQKEAQDIVGTMTPAAREAYEDRKAIRANPDAEYRSAAALYADDQPFATAPALNSPFARAASGRAPQPQTIPFQPGAKPASTTTDDYRSAPEF